MFMKMKDLPLERDGSTRFLPWLVGFMVYLAALALTAGIAMQKLVLRWDQGLAGRLTVQLPPPDSASPGAEGREVEARLAEVITLLQNTPGVTDAEALDRDEIAELLEPWLGDGVHDQDLPLPTLVSVTLDPEAAPDLGALSARLTRVVPGAVIDDHQRWLGNLLDFAHTIETLAILIVIAVGGTAVITVVFVTRAGLSIHRRVIDLLHLIGAQDSYIARQFQGHALRLGLQGGSIGLVLALATILLIGHLVERSQAALLPDLSLSLAEWLLLALLPLATALVAMVTARITVLRNLSRLP
ncbi:MAG: cell division protein [Kiloniellales bacterium]|nr:cell division protein [Kiloniellales bacterium]